LAQASGGSAGGEPPSESYATNLSLDSAAGIVAKRLRPLGSPLSLEFSNRLAQAMGQQPLGSANYADRHSGMCDNQAQVLNHRIERTSLIPTVLLKGFSISLPVSGNPRAKVSVDQALGQFPPALGSLPPRQPISRPGQSNIIEILLVAAVVGGFNRPPGPPFKIVKV
jgi:hypothetical protein